MGRLEAGTGDRQASCLGHRISGGSSSRGASSKSTPNSEGFLTLHTLGATLVRVAQAQRQKQWVLIVVPSLHGLDMSLNLSEPTLGIHKDKLRWIHEHTSI